MSEQVVTNEIAVVDYEQSYSPGVLVRECGAPGQPTWRELAPADLQTLWDGIPRVVEIRSPISEDVRLELSTNGFIDEPTVCRLIYSGPSGIEEERRERRLQDPRKVHQAITDVLNAGLCDPDATYRVKIDSPIEHGWFAASSDAHVAPVLDLIRRGAVLPADIEASIRQIVADPRLAAECGHAAVSLVKAGRAETIMDLAIQAGDKLRALFSRPDSTPTSGIAAAVVPVEYDVCGVPVVRVVNIGQMIVANALRQGAWAEANRSAYPIELAPGPRRQFADPISLADQDFAWSRRALDPSAHLGVQGALGALNFAILGTGYVNIAIGAVLHLVNLKLYGPLEERRNYQFHVARATNGFMTSTFYEAMADKGAAGK
jgi:hypothetical protein